MKRSAGSAVFIIVGAISMAFAGVKSLPLSRDALPVGITCKGEVVDGARWSDSTGENFVLLCREGPFRSPGSAHEDERDVELHAHRFVRSGKSWRRAWTVRDFERNCPLDLSVEFLPGSLTVTDLDGNGIAEVTFLYRLACRGDMSPSRMKLIMYEGTKKYAIRGITTMPPEIAFGHRGEMTPDAAFEKAPPAFLEYARARWHAFEVEKSTDHGKR